MHRSAFCVVLTVILAASGASAQAAQPDQTGLIKQLIQRIDKLEGEVTELKSALADATSRPEPISKPAPASDEYDGMQGMLGDHDVTNDVADPHDERHYPSLHFRGFADVDFAATDQKGAKSGFNMGQFILHAASPLSEHITYFGEFSFTAQPGNYTLDLERSLVRYDVNDFFKLSFGRYHTPINYWNTAYHHGLWLQTSISRPEMIRFGGRFQPVHFLGFLAEGNIPSGKLGLGYNAGLGNGRGATISRPGDSGDVNNNRAWLASLFARPAILHRFQIGGSVYRDEVSPAGIPGNPVLGEWISTAHVAWTQETPEFIAEFAHVRHRNVLTQVPYNSRSAYAQVAYRLPWNHRRWKPYYRFEFSNIALNDPLFISTDPTVAIKDLTGSTVGVRFDISSFAAFKWEYRNTQRGHGDPPVNGIFAQTSFTF